MATFTKRIYKTWRVSAPAAADLSKTFDAQADAAAYMADLKNAGHADAQIKKFESLGWQVRIRSKNAPPQTKTFSTKAMAEEWAKAREGEIVKRQFVDYSAADKETLGSLLQRYDAEKLAPHKNAQDPARSRIRKLCRHPITQIRMSAIQSGDFASFRDERLKGGFDEAKEQGKKAVKWAPVKGTSVKRELDLMSSIISHARREWKIHLALNPASGEYTRRPAPEEGDERDRRLHAVLLCNNAKEVEKTAFRSKREKPDIDYENDPEITALMLMPQSEQKAMLRASRYPEWFRPRKANVTPHTLLARAKKAKRPGIKARLRRTGGLWAVFSFAIETAMRRGEMLQLEWSHVHLGHGNGYLQLPGPITKNKKSRIVPLTLRALRILQTRPKVSKFVFAMTLDQVKSGWQRAKQRVAVVDLRLHDLRHEATSRLFEHTTLRSEEIGHITGHTDPRMLARYYNMRPEEIVDRFAKSRR